MKNRHKKSLAATSLALVISASGAVTSLALPQAAPDQEFTEAYQRLYDNEMDYDCLLYTALVTHSYQKSFLADGRCAVSTSRAGNVIGGGDFANDRIIPDCVRAAASGKDIIVRNPHSTRPYQLVLEPLAVYLTIAMRQYEDGKFQGYYNVGPDDRDCVTTGNLVDIFCRAWGNGMTWVDRYDGGPHEANFLKLDCSKIEHVFGWRPRYGVEEAVAKTVEWSKAYLDGQEMLQVMDRQIMEFFE